MRKLRAGVLEGGWEMIKERGIESGDNAFRVGGTPRVLVVEAHTRLLREVVAAFKGAGLETCACTKIPAAVEVLCGQHFDLIVLGVIVEQLFADEVLALLQSGCGSKPLPPVGVVSCLNEDATWACLRPGTPILGVLTRPLFPEKVAGWAKHLLEGKMKEESWSVMAPAESSPLSLWTLHHHSEVTWSVFENCGQGQAKLRHVNQFASATQQVSANHVVSQTQRLSALPAAT
jgi:CheY-like chemotaxis protein